MTTVQAGLQILDTTTGLLRQISTTDLQGPAGPQGPDGPQGPAGPAVAGIASVPGLQPALDAAATTARQYADSVGGGVELDYAQTSAPQPGIGSTIVDIAGLTIAPVVGARPIEVIINLDKLTITSVSGLLQFFLYDGATKVDDWYYGAGIPANQIFGWRQTKRLTPSAGTHVYKVQAVCIVAGTLTVNAGSLQAKQL